MKKRIVAILLSLLLLTVAACGQSDDSVEQNTDDNTDTQETVDQNDTGTTDDTTDDTADQQTEITSYRMSVKIIANGESTYYTVLKTADGWAYLLGTDAAQVGYMYVNEGSKYYMVNTDSQTLSLISEGDDSVGSSDTVDEIFESFMSGYDEYAVYFVNAGSDTIAGRSCTIYDFSYTYDDNAITGDYCIDEDLGFALSFNVVSTTASSTDSLAWEVLEFSIEEQTLAPYINWQITTAS